MNKISIPRRRRCITTFSGIFMGAFAMAQPLSGTYTINQNQLPSAGNFQSFTEAVAALQNNGIANAVVFEVSPGTYNEQVVITAINGASLTNTITFHGNEGTTLSYNSTDPNQRAIIKLNDADHIVLDNLIITATGNTATSYGYGVQLMNDADHNVIQNCNISTSLTTSNTISPNYAGIIVSATDLGIVVNGSGLVTGLGDARCDYNSFRNNTIRGGYFSIAIGANGSTAVVSNNEIKNNTLVDFYRTGIYLNGNSHTLIRNNDISRPDRPTNSVFQFFGFWIDGYSSGLVIDANKIHDPFGNIPTATSTCHPFYIQNCNAEAGNENVCSNNAIYNLNSNGTLSAIDITGSSRFNFIHNSISIDDVTSTAITSRGIVTTNSNYISFRNNILNFTRGGQSFSSKYAYHLAAGVGNVFDHNDIYFASTIGMANFGRLGTTNFANLAAWQNGTSYDANSTDEDPQFTNASAGDLLPTNSNLQMASLGTGISTDIIGLGRSNTTPTIGAFEINGTVLPVRLSPLSGKVNVQGRATLVWTTFSESNNKGFIIERSNDGISWKEQGFTATKAFLGNSSTAIQYSYEDLETMSSTCFYRLKQVDIEGQFSFSNIVALAAPQQTFPFTAQVYPNPASGQIQLVLSHLEHEEVGITIADQTGRVFLQKEWSTVMPSIDVSPFPNGLYLITITKGKDIYHTKFVKQ